MTFKQALISLIGSYSNNVVVYGDNQYIIPDVEYIACVFLLGIILLSIFKLIGGMICK